MTQLVVKTHYQGIKTRYEELKSYQNFMSIMNFFYGKITIVLKPVMNVLKNLIKIYYDDYQNIART